MSTLVEKPRLQYFERVIMKRQERDAIMKDMFDAYTTYRNTFIEIERNIMELTLQLNSEKYRKSQKKYIRCYLKYFPLVMYLMWPSFKKYDLNFLTVYGGVPRRNLSNDRNPSRYIQIRKIEIFVFYPGLHCQLFNRSHPR